MNRKQDDLLEVLPGKLYWSCQSSLPARVPYKHHFFSIDSELVYNPFFNDFGPLNLGMVYRYCRLVEDKLKKYEDMTLVHFCSTDFRKKSNSVFALGCYLIIVQKSTSDKVWQIFKSVFPPFAPFRDATCGSCSFQLNLIDCWKGLEKGIALGWFNYSTFDLQVYEHYERIENGDMNWIVPGKFLAYACPCASTSDPEGCRVAEYYAPIFKQAGIELVIRLNKKLYSTKPYTDLGLKVLDLFFADGSCPAPEIVSQFMAAVDQTKGGVAIHCKAGLGRTGTLIGLYCEKHYGFTGREFIGWVRICRPGSILGPQQQYLCDMEKKGVAPKVVMKEEELREDFGQGERLIEQKMKVSLNFCLVEPKITALDTPSSQGDYRSLWEEATF